MDGSALMHMDHAVALQSENLTAVMEALTKAEIEKLMDEQARREQQVDADKLKQYDAALRGLINALNQAMASMNASGGVAISLKGIVTSIEGMRAAIQLHIAKIALQENKTDTSVKPVLASLDGKLIIPQDARPSPKTDAKSKPVSIAAQAAKFEKYLTALKDNKALPFPIRAIIENVLHSLQKLGVSSRADLKAVIINSMTPRQPANDITARIEARKAANNDNQLKGEKTEGINADVKTEAKGQTIKGETPNGEPRLGTISDAKMDIKLSASTTSPGERLAVTSDLKSVLYSTVISAASVATSTATVSVASTFANTPHAASVTSSAAAPVSVAPASIIPVSVASITSSPSAPASFIASSVAATAPINAIPTSAAPIAVVPLASVTILSEYHASHPTPTPTVATQTVVTPTSTPVTPTGFAPTIHNPVQPGPITPTAYVAPTTPNPIQTNEAIGGSSAGSIVIDNKVALPTGGDRVDTHISERATNDDAKNDHSQQETNRTQSVQDTKIISSMDMYRTETPDANQQKSFLTNVTSTIGNVTNNMTTSVKGVVTMFKNAAKGICENCTHSCPGCPRGINAKQIALNKAQMHAEFK